MQLPKLAKTFKFEEVWGGEIETKSCVRDFLILFAVPVR